MITWFQFSLLRIWSILTVRNELKVHIRRVSRIFSVRQLDSNYWRIFYVWMKTAVLLIFSGLWEIAQISINPWKCVILSKWWDNCSASVKLHASLWRVYVFEIIFRCSLTLFKGNVISIVSVTTRHLLWII